MKRVDRVLELPRVRREVLLSHHDVRAILEVHEVWLLNQIETSRLLVLYFEVQHEFQLRQQVNF